MIKECKLNIKLNQKDVFGDFTDDLAEGFVAATSLLRQEQHIGRTAARVSRPSATPNTSIIDIRLLCAPRPGFFNGRSC
ncbi:MAG: hypothetical protein GXO88_13990 [Chlorobi bacterium]|nr:hypothetical protein [Chlorobiota bacterium]